MKDDTGSYLQSTHAAPTGLYTDSLIRQQVGQQGRCFKSQAAKKLEAHIQNCGKSKEKRQSTDGAGVGPDVR